MPAGVSMIGLSKRVRTTANIQRKRMSKIGALSPYAQDLADRHGFTDVKNRHYLLDPA
jgi:hypothetical protein